MDASSASVVAAAVIILLTFAYIWIKNRGVLPGPVGVPYLGLYPYLTDQNVHLKLEEYTKIYGDVFSFTYTGRLYINLGTIKAMREVLLSKSDCFMEKYTDTNIIGAVLGKSLVFVNGERWKVLRKFFIQKFKEYGLNAVRDNMAGPVYDTLNTTIEDLKNAHGKPVNVAEFLGQRTGVTLRKIIFGEKGITDENLEKIVTSYLEALEKNFGVNLLLIGPLARLLFSLSPTFRSNLNSYKKATKIIFECVQRMESSMNEENPTCIVEEFYKERNKRRRENNSTWTFFTDETLVESIMQFLGDGIQGVVGFLDGLLNTLSEHPDEQEKLYYEIKDLIGPNRQPSAEDKPNLPYTNAFINEYIRHTRFVVFLPTVECTKETTLRGYRIPVGSIAIYNFHTAHNDPEIFDDPQAFNPSRYIPSSDKPKLELPVLFGMGKRSCAGEAFVMLQIFLFLTTIVQNFKIVSSNKAAEHIVDLPASGKYELIFAARTEN